MNANIERRASFQIPQTTYLPSAGPEIWLYDERHLPVLLSSGVLDPRDPLAATKFKALTKQGLVVGYGLSVSHHVTVSVQVGEPLTAEQLSELHHGRWLPPETALLDVPTGRLCIESRERLAVSPELATSPSGRVYARSGRYRVSLYQSDDAARERESLDWVGPQQVLVLTPGGTRSDAADGPLGPVAPHADTPASSGVWSRGSTPSAPLTRSAAWCV